MTDSYQHTLTQAQASINAGEKQHALQLLKQAVEQNSADPRPWLLMVYVAPTKKLALEYLERARQRGAKILYYSQAKRWIENFYGETLLEEVPPTPGLVDRIRESLDRSPELVALVYLAFLAQAEATIVARNPSIGMVMHGLCLAILLIHASFFSKKRSQPFLLSLALTPLIRLISLTLPLNAFPLVYWYAIVGTPLFLAAYLMVRTTHITNRQIGLTAKSIPVQILIGLAGILLGYLEYLILRPQPLVDQFRFGVIILPALMLLIFTGFLEELIFRGLLQHSANLFIGRWGILYVAFIFAIFHFGYQSYADFFFVLLVSLLFSYIVHKTGSIVGVTLAHGLTNIFLYLIFPFIIIAQIN
jgi:membrane protease YdiL (CAAX protease family)